MRGQDATKGMIQAEETQYLLWARNKLAETDMQLYLVVAQTQTCLFSLFHRLDHLLWRELMTSAVKKHRRATTHPRMKMTTVMENGMAENAAWILAGGDAM